MKIVVLKNVVLLTSVAIVLIALSSLAVIAYQRPASAQEIGQITVLLQRGDVDAAAKIWCELITDPSTDFDSLLQVGRVLAEHKIFRDAQSAFARAVQVNPGSFAPVFNLGWAYF
jgi:cytochrome c-type biogenesis protein CcmH/NrfG